jgi:hypothetical protein
MWLAKYYPTYYPILNVYWSIDYEFPVDFIKAKRVECNFTVRLQRCNRSDFHAIATDLAQSELEAKMRISYADSVVIFVTPVICLVGIVANILVLVTVARVKRDKEMKDHKHYDYMRINSICDICLFCVQQICGMINE